MELDGRVRMGRIDTHHHVIPPSWRDYLLAKDYFGGQPIPAWSADAALAFMDDLDIDTAVMSVSRPGVHLTDLADTRVLAREVNDFSAELVRTHPDRFGFFASLPFPDVDAALDEIGRALDDLSADGVVLLSQIDGCYVGHERFDPLFEELNRRDGVLFVHPTHPNGAGLPGVPPFVADFLLDTTRAAIAMVQRDIPDRFPRVRIILSHGGGFVPYAAHRIAQLLPGADVAEVDREGLLRQLRSFHFDTALSAAGSGWDSLRAFASPERVLYGSDWPYAPGESSRYFARELEAQPLAEAELRAVVRDNAQRLFPRLRAR